MKMGDNPDTKQICRLCLDVVPAADAEAIGEKKKTILEVLLINVDLHVIENAVACSRCMEELQSGFEFKSACLHVENCISTFVDADVPVDINDIFNGEISTALANVNLENRQVCLLCMSLIPGKAVHCNMDIKDLLGSCLPEVDIHIVHEPLVCELCFSRMKKLNEFMKSCQEVERTINNYCHATAGLVSPVSVSLKDLLKFKDSTINTLIKEECSNFDSNVLKDLKEDVASIECEEIHIKTELESGDEMEDSIPCNNTGNSRSLKRKRQIRHVTSKERRHFSSDSDMARHRGLNEEFACLEGAYKTDRSILARHVIIHNDKSEVEMCKREICKYETKYKNNMIQHMVKRRDRKAERKFKCDECPYETNIRHNLHLHSLRHKDKLEVEMFKCYNCEYETRFKSDMKKHVVKHRDPKAEKNLKCDKCPYETDRRDHLNQHKLIHKNRSEVEMHKCENCEYETKRKSCMIRHMLNHRDPKAESKFKCDKCPYETNYKYNLRGHNLIHTNRSEVQMHKCTNCEFETMYKRSLIRHMVKHRDPKAERENLNVIKMSV